jgi:hypothetical protein
VAATAKADGTSALASTWRVMHHSSSVSLEQWYFALLEREVPRAPVAVPIPPPLAAAPNVTFAGEAAARQADHAKLLVTIMETLMKSRDGSPESGKDYPTHDREKLYMILGTAKPWDGLGEDLLPLTYRNLKSFRSKALGARNFLENNFKKMYPGETRDSHPFTWSTELLRAFRELDFVAGDELCNWENRAKGISLFSIAPSDQYGDGGKSRAEMLAFEKTVGNHTPADAARMAALSATMAQVPSDRLGVRAWVDHAEIWLSVHFSPKCQVLGALQDILQYLRNPVKFSQYEATNFRALIWNLHCALRSFFGDGDVASLEYIAYQLKVNLVIATDGLPEAMRCPEVVTDSSSMGTDLSSLSQDLSRKRSAPPGLLHQEDTRRRRGPHQACFAILYEDIERARRACEPRQLKGRQLAEGSNGIRASFWYRNLQSDGGQQTALPQALHLWLLYVSGLPQRA